MLVAVLLIAIPLALLGSVLRLRKRRITLGAAMLWLALFAGDFAMFRAKGELAILALWLLYATPFAFFVLHVPRDRDVWIAAILALAVAFLWGFAAVSDELMRRRMPPPTAATAPISLPFHPTDARTARDSQRP